MESCLQFPLGYRQKESLPDCRRALQCTKVNPAHSQTHYGISVEQADGRFELEKGKNGGNAGDPFPGVLGNRTFSVTSTPNSSSFYFWNGYSPVPGTSGVRISNIKEIGQNIKADLGYDAQGKW